MKVNLLLGDEAVKLIKKENNLVGSRIQLENIHSISPSLVISLLIHNLLFFCNLPKIKDVKIC